MKFGIGQPVRRYEDLRLITGRGRYTDDVSLPHSAQAFVLRSPAAHAHLRRIDATAARKMPGVLLVATGADVKAEGLGNLACQTPVKNSDGTPQHETPRPLLAIEKVRYVGQPVAFVVAETLSQARDAAEAIEVDYEALPVVTEAKDALAPGVAQLFDHIPGNLVFDWDNDLGDPKATEAAFAKAAHVVSIDLINNRLVANSMEPRNAVVDYDPQSGRSTLYTGTQGPHFVRDPLAEAVLKIPKEQLRVITPNVGGGFGMKAFVYPEQALAVWASRKIARPVKWQEDRSEGFISDNQGRDHATHAELALDKSGRFLGLRVTTLANLGAYLSPFGSFVPTRSTDLVSGLYDFPRHPCECERRVHQHGAGLRLSRRRAAGSRLPPGTDRRRGSARTWHDARRHPARQFRAFFGDALHVGDQARARFRRVREGDGPLHGGGRLVLLSRAA